MDLFDSLPPETVMHVLSYLDRQSLACVSTLSWRAFGYARDGSLWQTERDGVDARMRQACPGKSNFDLMRMRCRLMRVLYCVLGVGVETAENVADWLLSGNYRVSCGRHYCEHSPVVFVKATLPIRTAGGHHIVDRVRAENIVKFDGIQFYGNGKPGCAADRTHDRGEIVRQIHAYVERGYVLCSPGAAFNEPCRTGDGGRAGIVFIPHKLSGTKKLYKFGFLVRG